MQALLLALSITNSIMADFELSQIEDFFNAQRAKRGWQFRRVDTLDWALMLQWQNSNMPFSVIARGIEEVFTSHRSRAAKGEIFTLRYCRKTVDAQYKNWLEAHVGSHDASTGHESDFGEQRIADALQNWIEFFKNCVADTSAMQDAFNATSKSLQDLFATHQTISLEALDANLALIENDLTAALIVEADEDERLAKYRTEAEKSLASYRDKMLPNVFEQTLQTAIHKKLRADYDLPRLSLFYL